MPPRLSFDSACRSMRGTHAATDETGGHMLETIIVLLVVLWLAGMVSSYTIGGLLHVLLVLAAIVLLVRLIQGRRVV